MSNIEIGIDLGTTNSEVAIFDNGNIEIAKNIYGDSFTPSVFGVNKAGDEEVGKKPYERYFKNPSKQELQNNKPEVKRLMGTNDKVYFKRIDKDYNAEEISAKILESLKQDAVRKNNSINTSAVVITIPAYFSTIQAEATKRAGVLAGFKYTLLLQEPIAAAISYGFGKNKNENWLVYDLGGGTFDSALISSKEGNLKVLSHSGDNFLGGKDIDALIVDKVIVPELKNKYDLEDFERSNSNYAIEFAKLKYFAEQAKIQLSASSEVNIEIDLTIDDNEIYENISFTQAQLEEISSEIINRTIKLCQKTISDAGLKNESVNKIIFVGGPTQLPFIKKNLEEKLGIKGDTSSDPLTAVAKGACIFATSQAIPQEFNENKIIDENTYELELKYESLTSDEDELITGLIPALKDDENEYYIQIQSEDNTFNSGRIKLKNGKFISNVEVKPHQLNHYWIYLFDNSGTPLKISIDDFSITHGLTISGAPIPHSVGVGLSIKDYSTGEYKQEYDKYFDKNSILPLEKTVVYHTVKRLNKGSDELLANALPITVYEGENPIPEQNTFICEVSVSGKDIDFDLPEGSDIEVTIKIDESRTLTLEAYIPIMDKAFNARATVYDEEISVSKLQDNVNKEVDEVKEIEHLCSYEEKEEIYSQIQEIKTSLKSSQNDEDEKRKTNAKIKELQANVNELKANKNFDSIKATYEKHIVEIAELIEDCSNEDKKVSFKKRFEAIKRDGEKALQTNNVMLLNQVNNQLYSLGGSIVVSDDYTWVYWLNDLIKNPSIANNPECEPIINKSLQAAKDKNFRVIKECVRELWEFLPSSEAEELKSKIAGITK